MSGAIIIGLLSDHWLILTALKAAIYGRIVDSRELVKILTEITAALS